MSLSGFFKIITPLVLGKMSDVFGRKILFLVSLLSALLALIFPLIGICLHSFFIVALGGVVGIFNVAKVIGKASIIDVTKGTERKFCLGLTILAVTLASTLGPLIGNYLSNSANGSFFNLKTPYYLGLFFFVLNLILIILFFKDPNKIIEHKRSLPISNIFKSLLSIKHEQKLIKPLIGLVFFELGYVLYGCDIPIFWHGYMGQSITEMSRYFAYMSGVTGLSVITVYPLWLKWGPKNYQIKMPILVMIISIICVSLLPTQDDKWLFTAPLAICSALSYPLIFKVGKAEDSQLPQTYSLVTAFSCLHWVRDVEACFKEAYAALKPGGNFLALTFPKESIYWQIFVEGLKQDAFKAYYPNSIAPFMKSNVELQALAQNAGFKISKWDALSVDAIYASPQAFKDYVNGWLGCVFDASPEIHEAYLNQVTELACQQYSKEGGLVIPYTKLHIYLEK